MFDNLERIRTDPRTSEAEKKELLYEIASACGITTIRRCKLKHMTSEAVYTVISLTKQYEAFLQTKARAKCSTNLNPKPPCPPGFVQRQNKKGEECCYKESRAKKTTKTTRPAVEPKLEKPPRTCAPVACDGKRKGMGADAVGNDVFGNTIEKLICDHYGLDFDKSKRVDERITQDRRLRDLFDENLRRVFSSTARPTKYIGENRSPHDFEMSDGEHLSVKTNVQDDKVAPQSVGQRGIKKEYERITDFGYVDDKMRGIWREVLVDVYGKSASAADAFVRTLLKEDGEGGKKNKPSGFRLGRTRTDEDKLQLEFVKKLLVYSDLKKRDFRIRYVSNLIQHLFNSEYLLYVKCNNLTKSKRPDFEGSFCFTNTILLTSTHMRRIKDALYDSIDTLTYTQNTQTLCKRDGRSSVGRTFKDWMRGAAKVDGRWRPLLDEDPYCDIGMSSTFKIRRPDGALWSIGEYQLHSNRAGIKFRFNLENLLLLAGYNRLLSCDSPKPTPRCPKGFVKKDVPIKKSLNSKYGTKSCCQKSANAR